MRSLIVCFSLSLVILSCGKVENESPIFSYQSDELFTRIAIDTLRLRHESFSGNGFLRAQNNQILFFDYIFSSVSSFDTDGNFIDKNLGIGEGPTEIPLAFAWYDLLESGEHLFMGRVSNIHYYNANFTQKSRLIFERPPSRNVYKGYADHDLGMYGFDLILGAAMGASNSLAVDRDEQLYVPVRILDRVSPNFNFYTKNYYEKSFTVGIISTKSGKFESGFGQWPKEYQEKILPHMDDRFICIKEDSIYVSYNASPSIQVYSPFPELELQYSFGVEGKGISNDYRSIRSLEEKSEHQSKRGFYTHMYYDKQANRIFRSYFKDASPDSSSGLQIYEDGVLIADLKTPKHFNVIGKVNGYYYADGNQDEENDILEVYRFKF